MAELELDELGEEDLRARKTDLEAMKLEIERALSKGQLWYVQDVADEVAETDSVVKSLMLAIPGRVAVQMQGATVEQARELIEIEVEQALRVLYDYRKRWHDLREAAAVASK